MEMDEATLRFVQCNLHFCCWFLWWFCVW